MWAKTGIASMRDAGLAELPEELWAVAHSIRVSSLLLTGCLALQRHTKGFNQVPDSLSAAYCLDAVVRPLSTMTSCAGKEQSRLNACADGGCELHQTTDLAAQTDRLEEQLEPAASQP